MEMGRFFMGHFCFKFGDPFNHNFSNSFDILSDKHLGDASLKMVGIFVVIIYQRKSVLLSKEITLFHGTCSIKSMAIILIPVYFPNFNGR